jgi:integrase/recombinase XerD
MKVRLKYLVSYNDRHGKLRHYVKKPGERGVPIKEQLHTEAFMAAYHAALRGQRTELQPEAAKAGSFHALCIAYFSSNKFKSHDPTTRSWRRAALESICKVHGGKPVALMESRHVRKIRNEREDKPSIANQRMKALRALFAWANEEEVFHRNPTTGVKNLEERTEGHHTWTEEELAQYCAAHPIGSQARLALDLMRYTACRREDACRLGPQHVKDGRIRFRQGKNEGRAPVDMDMPLHENLRKSIEATTTGDMVFLVTRWGKGFTPKSFGNRFKEWCRQANLPHCSAHGVRKATATALAEGASSPHQIGAVTGHSSLKEIERYTRKARRKILADEAISRLK